MASPSPDLQQPPVPTPPALGSVLRGMGVGGGARGAGGRGRSSERPRDWRRVVRRLLPYILRQRRFVLASALCVVITVLLDLSGPFLIGRAVDRHLVTGELNGLSWLLALLATAYLSSALLGYLQNRLMARASQNVMRDLRTDLFGHLQRLPLSYYDSRMQGDIMARMTSDVESINQVLSQSVGQLVTGALSLAAVAITMLWLNPLLAAVSIFSIAGLTLNINRLLSRHSAPRYREQQAALGRLYAFFEEAVNGQRVAKACGQEQLFVDEAEQVSRDYANKGIRAQSITGLTGPLMNFASNLALLIVAGVGGLLAVNGRGTVGILATFIHYTRQFGRPLNEVAHLYNAFQSALAGAERILEVMDEPPEDTESGPSRGRPLRGRIEFDRVRFSYLPGIPVLSDLTLTVSPGQTVALIGPTGAGKTTLVNILLRFYEIEGGCLRIDSLDSREWAKEPLRRQFGMVLQESFLFRGTVRDNIRYGRLEATDAEVEAAAREANAHDFILELPDGYATEVGERGATLSHGQRQMIAIARALLANPVVLILDEATSSVDTRTEKLIQEAMRQLMRGRTCFIIAHRLSTIRDADLIVAIQGGRIAEQGTHEELLALRGYYWTMLRQMAAEGGGTSRAAGA